MCEELGFHQFSYYKSITAREREDEKLTDIIMVGNEYYGEIIGY